MKKSYRLILLLALFILSYLSILLYFYCKKINSYNSLELFYSRIFMLISFNLFFYSLIFIINIDYYKQIFRIIIIVIASIWLFELITWAYFDLIPISTQYGTLGELMIFLSFSVIGQGLVIYIIYYIKKHTAKFNKSKVFGNYHIHEGFIGIIFLIIALFLLTIRSSLLFLSDIWWKRMSIILWSIQILLFIFLIS